MKGWSLFSRRLLAWTLVLAGASAGLGWYGWHWYSVPEPPALDLAEAEPAVAQAIQAALGKARQEPRSAAAWGKLGLVLRAHGYDDESNICFAHAEKLDSRNPRWPYLQGSRIYRRDREAGLPYLRRAVALCDQYDPENTAPRLHLAEVLMEKDQRDEAETLVHPVLRKQPENPRAHLDMAMLAFAGGHLEESISHLARSATSPFAQQKSFALLAAIYQRLGQEATAAEFARRGRQLPKDRLWVDPYATEYLELAVGRQARFEQAESLEGKGRDVKTAGLLREIAEEFPDARSHTALGIALARMGDFEAAEPVLRTALRQEPGKMQAHYFLSVALYQQGEHLQQSGNQTLALEKYREAADSALQALNIKPDHAFAHIFLGLALRRLGQRAEAIAAFRTGVQCRPELPEGHLHLGEALAETGQVGQALQELRTAVQLASPKDQKPPHALARVLAKVVGPVGWP